ncbi:MAG: 30S ribosomal protein S12 methylthiotransferase RimO [Candidatus Omnitrophica bacterium]|nr:30S ribosomal protein S12 methylthiotransferase RimO [Candidatus Omnitrophota bacterium]
MPTFRMISLGCSRNLVDSEVIAGSLKRAGYDPVADGPGDLCIINTCAFIEEARKESVDAIIEAGSLKRSGKIGHIVVCGCLPQLYKKKLGPELPEADLIVGTADFPHLPRLLKKLSNKQRIDVSKSPRYIYDEHSSRMLLTPGHYAYVKISEGCSNRCSYCIISRLRGNLRSRPIASILREVEMLAAPAKLREINLVGQDTTRYGYDLYGRPRLSELVKRLSGLNNGIGWIRLLYTHPAHYTEDLIKTVRDEDRVCKYLDIPIQHSSDRILKAMNRRTTKKDLIGLIDKVRSMIPNITLRTSVIVGFPGETEKDFSDLVKFVREVSFDRLGAFVYSREDGTCASKMPKQIPGSVKASRLDEIMKVQQTVSLSKNRKKIGSRMKVLIDEREAGCPDKFVGRTEGDAPEVDGNIIVSGKDIKIGEFCDVRITDAMEYDLVGESVE